MLMKEIRLLRCLPLPSSLHLAVAAAGLAGASLFFYYGRRLSDVDERLQRIVERVLLLEEFKAGCLAAVRRKKTRAAADCSARTSTAEDDVSGSRGGKGQELGTYSSQPWRGRLRGLLAVLPPVSAAARDGHYCIECELSTLEFPHDGEAVAGQAISNTGESYEAVSVGFRKKIGGYKMPILGNFGTNLTNLAEEGMLEPVIGKEQEIERVIQILSKRAKNNPCILGQNGVRGADIAEGLAQRIVVGEVPETMAEKHVIALDVALFLAGIKCSRECEERAKKLISEMKENNDVILFIDEVHKVIGAGSVEGSVDASNILKTALARGDLQCIAATTSTEYNLHIEKDLTVVELFQPVRVSEPTVDETIEILKSLCQRYEIYHKVRFQEDALVAAAELSHKYILSLLPDKAINLIDEAGAFIKLRNSMLPEEVRELKKKLMHIIKEKREAMLHNDVAKLRELNIREMEIRTQISALISKHKDARISANKGGDDNTLLVMKEDIQQLLSTWTGIPVDFL